MLTLYEKSGATSFLHAVNCNTWGGQDQHVSNPPAAALPRWLSWAIMGLRRLSWIFMGLHWLLWAVVGFHWHTCR